MYFSQPNLKFFIFTVASPVIFAFPLSGHCNDKGQDTDSDAEYAAAFPQTERPFNPLDANTAADALLIGVPLQYSYEKGTLAFRDVVEKDLMAAAERNGISNLANFADQNRMFFISAEGTEHGLAVATRWANIRQDELNSWKHAAAASFGEPGTQKFRDYMELNFQDYLEHGMNDPENPFGPAFKMALERHKNYNASLPKSSLIAARGEIIDDFGKILSEELTRKEAALADLLKIQYQLTPAFFASFTKNPENLTEEMKDHGNSAFRRKLVPGAIISGIFLYDIYDKIRLSLEGRNPGFLPVVTELTLERQKLIRKLNSDAPETNAKTAGVAQ